MAVLEYSDKPVVHFPLDRTHEAGEVKKLVDKIEPSGGTDVVTGEAIEKAGKKVFSVEYGERPTANKILIIITDGSPTGEEPPREAIKPLKKAGVSTYLVSIGGKPDQDELEEITGIKNIVPRKDKDKIPDAAPKIVHKIYEHVTTSRLCLSLATTAALILIT